MTPRYTTNPGWIIGNEELIHQIGEYDIYRSTRSSDHTTVFAVWGSDSSEQGAWSDDSFRVTDPAVRAFCQAYENLLS